MIELDKYSFEDESTNGVIVFTGAYCKPCKMLCAWLKENERNYPNLTFYQADSDDCCKYLADMDVYELPTAIFRKNGEEQGRFVGNPNSTTTTDILMSWNILAKG